MMPRFAAPSRQSRPGPPAPPLHPRPTTTVVSTTNTASVKVSLANLRSQQPNVRLHRFPRANWPEEYGIIVIAAMHDGYQISRVTLEILNKQDLYHVADTSLLQYLFPKNLPTVRAIFERLHEVTAPTTHKEGSLFNVYCLDPMHLIETNCANGEAVAYRWLVDRNNSARNHGISPC